MATNTALDKESSQRSLTNGRRRRTESELCAKYFDVRHLNGIAIRFVDVDATQVIFCGKLNESQTDNRCDQSKFFKFNDRKLGKAMDFFFGVEYCEAYRIFA